MLDSIAEAAPVAFPLVLSFATVGALAPRLGRVIGMHRATVVALVALTGGLWFRTRMDSGPPFLLLSFLALSGMAVANVLLPSLVKLHFPDRVGLLTSLYSTFLALGLTSASVLTVPIAQRGTADDGTGLDWRLGLVAWALTAAVAVLATPVLAEEVVEGLVDIEEADDLAEIRSDADGAVRAMVVARLDASASVRPEETVELVVNLQKLHFFDLDTGATIGA